MTAYRDLIDAPEFWPWYTASTPIAHIARLSIASRPISRKGMAELDFEGLRAIPWVFSWTQPRFTAPGWYGVGTALSEAITGDDLEALRRLAGRRGHSSRRSRATRCGRWRAPGWWSAVDTARSPSRPGRRRRPSRPSRPSSLAPRRHCCAWCERDTLLDSGRAIAATIRYRNPATDVLNLVQLDLLRRWRGDLEAGGLAPALLLSVNAIAAAMQSTG